MIMLIDILAFFAFFVLGLFAGIGLTASKIMENNKISFKKLKRYSEDDGYHKAYKDSDYDDV